LYANAKVQSHCELDEFAGAEFRNLASQQIAHIGLMNLESLFEYAWPTPLRSM
jgi:hypothetical protein